MPPVIGTQAHSAILRRVASTAVEDARAAWKRARATPSEKTIRAAFRSCVFAARALRNAAKVLPRDARKMIEEAKTLDDAAIALVAGLHVRIEADAAG